MLNFIYTRLSEPSTWRGLTALATAAGIALTPEQSAAVTAVGLAVIGVIGAFFPDKVK